MYIITSVLNNEVSQQYVALTLTSAYERFNLLKNNAPMDMIDCEIIYSSDTDFYCKDEFDKFSIQIKKHNVTI